MKKLFLVRHGNTFSAGETPLYVGARSDLPLTEEGHKQGQRVGEVLSREKFSGTEIYSGPLKRQLETAAEINKQFAGALEIVTASELVEIDYGLWEGLSEEEIKSSWATEYEQWTKKSLWPAKIFATLEPEQQMRIQSFLARIAVETTDAIVVTSNGVLRIIYSMLSPNWNELQSRGETSKAKVRTGAYCLLEYDGKKWMIRSWNERP
ncbi:MAG: histidine phosphatase family protein [bacterium]|nr:histidine phosphatase family protein [bacterium]